MKELLFIVNPVAGSGKGARLFEKVRKELDSRGIPYRAEFTRGKGHAARLAREAISAGYGAVISAGGDGTAGEVAGALLNSQAHMGILPFGTGNDFAHCLGIPSDPISALDAVLSGRAREVDGGWANGECFINVAGTGFDVDVIRYTDKFKARMNGMLPYLLGVFQALMHSAAREYTITADGETFTQRALLLSVCNGVRFAGGMRVAPEASPYDGLLDLCILDDLSKPEFLKLLPRYVKGRHLDSPHIRYLRAREIKVEGDGLPLNLDGELGSSLPAVFRALPGALRVLGCQSEDR